MSELNVESQPLVEENVNNQQIFNNIKRLSIGDGSLRVEGGALIVSDENGVDRVLIGYGKGLF